jgi:hypothetical protein
VAKRRNCREERAKVDDCARVRSNVLVRCLALPAQATYRKAVWNVRPFVTNLSTFWRPLQAAFSEARRRKDDRMLFVQE